MELWCIKSIYEAPLNFEKDKLGDQLLDALKLPEKRRASLAKWKKFALAATNIKVPEINIAIVGKYFDTGDFVLADAYLSVIEAIKFSAAKLNRRVNITWVNSKNLEGSNAKTVAELGKYQGIIVPGGFGESGIEGKMKAIQFAREKKIPYFGLCYGMQLMVL